MPHKSSKTENLEKIKYMRLSIKGGLVTKISCSDSHIRTSDCNTVNFLVYYSVCFGCLAMEELSSQIVYSYFCMFKL